MVHNSAFVENAAGAIGNSGTIQVTNTTFAGNRESFNCFGTTITNVGRMALVNTTFAENTAPPFCGFTTQSVIDAPAGETWLQNSIIQNSGDPSFVQDCTGMVTSLGNNLIQNPRGCTIHVTDLFGEADLGLFTDDSTPGHAHFPLLPQSRAIDAANDKACPKRDQIGQLRRPRCDIGAIEFRREHRH